MPSRCHTCPLSLWHVSITEAHHYLTWVNPFFLLGSISNNSAMREELTAQQTWFWYISTDFHHMGAWSLKKVSVLRIKIAQ